MSFLAGIDNKSRNKIQTMKKISSFGTDSNFNYNYKGLIFPCKIKFNIELDHICFSRNYR